MCTWDRGGLIIAVNDYEAGKRQIGSNSRDFMIFSDVQSVACHSCQILVKKWKQNANGYFVIRTRNDRAFLFILEITFCIYMQKERNIGKKV